MNKFTTLSCAFSLLAILPASLAAAPAAELKVTGTIVPSACQLTLDNNGLVEYGKIPTTTLNRNTFTPLALKGMYFNIKCEAPARVAILAKPARGVSAVNKDGALGELADSGITLGGINVPGKATAAGLGLHNSKGIGGYALVIHPTFHKADNKAVKLILSDNTVSWAGVSTIQPMFYESRTLHFSWSSDGKQPSSHTNFVGAFQIQAYINKSTELDLSKEVKLDGLATLELFYL